MGSKSSGLRNRYRNGRGKYSISRKGQGADAYGSYTNGTLTRAENIAGHNISTQLKSAQVGRRPEHVKA